MKFDIFCFLLQMKVTGNNLTNICMVVYRVAKTEKNDQLFLEEDILSKINLSLITNYEVSTGLLKLRPCCIDWMIVIYSDLCLGTPTKVCWFCLSSLFPLSTICCQLAKSSRSYHRFSLRPGHWANNLAMKTILPTWFDREKTGLKINSSAWWPVGPVSLNS